MKKPAQPVLEKASRDEGLGWVGLGGGGGGGGGHPTCNTIDGGAHGEEEDRVCGRSVEFL